MTRETDPSLALLFGARMRFRDGVHGHLTGICVDSESRALTGIGVSGHPNGDQFYVSIDVVTAAFPDSVHLNQRRDSMISEPGPRSAWLTPDQPVRWTDPDQVGARLKGVIIDRETRRLETLVIAAGRRESLLCLSADEIMELPNSVVAVRRGATQWNDLSEYRADEDEQKDVVNEGRREGLSSPQTADAAPADVTECGEGQ